MRIFLDVQVLLAFIFALSIPYPSAASGPPSDDIMNAGKEGIKLFLRDSRISGLDRLGFESKAVIDSAELGEVFQIFTIHPDKLLDEFAHQETQSLATPTNQWQFLVVSGGKANALLTVDLVDGKWIPVSIGSSELAKELSGFLAAWPSSSGYEFRLIRVYQAKSDIVELSQRGKVIGIVPLTSIIMTEGRAKVTFNSSDVRDPKEVLSDLQTVVKRNIQIDK